MMIPEDIRRAGLEFAFKYHPDREAVIEELMGDTTIERIDQLFAEEEAAAVKRWGLT